MQWRTIQCSYHVIFAVNSYTDSGQGGSEGVLRCLLETDQHQRKRVLLIVYRDRCIRRDVHCQRFRNQSDCFVERICRIDELLSERIITNLPLNFSLPRVYLTPIGPRARMRD